MDAAAHYRDLLALGRDEFLAVAAPAALVRRRAASAEPSLTGQTLTVDLDELEGDPGEAPPADLEVYPLAKKPGASFPDRITIGRTANNDVEIADASVSRLHAYVRTRQPGNWVVADAGSKNGSWLDDTRLEPRREVALAPGSALRLGDVALAFYPSDHLFDLLGGR
ncbi:MAG TPA: FHA domain-containing protein [Kofleriaceae bacterium]